MRKTRMRKSRNRRCTKRRTTLGKRRRFKEGGGTETEWTAAREARIKQLSAEAIEKIFGDEHDFLNGRRTYFEGQAMKWKDENGVDDEDFFGEGIYNMEQWRNHGPNNNYVNPVCVYTNIMNRYMVDVS